MANKFSIACWNDWLDALVARVGNGGKLRVYNGSEPAHIADPVTGIPLVEFALASPMAPAASGGVLAPTLPSPTTALASGNASQYRVLTMADVAVFGGSVTAVGGGGDIELSVETNDVAIIAGAEVSVSSWIISRPSGGY